MIRHGVALGLALVASPALAQQPQPSPSPSPLVHEYLEVTTTRIPEDAAKLPAALTVVSGQDLRDRGATDLRSALALVAGVEIAPGGDGGPAASVPEIWGLKEFDAFLLVVDGVPWGGAFNPALASLDLADVERVEVLRGPAPVMYGATSFVGVIQVIHRSAAEKSGRATLGGGSYESGQAAVGLRLPKWAGFDSGLDLDVGRQGFRDDRTWWKRAHLLWRNQRALSNGVFRFDVNATALDQSPASPHPREGASLSPLVPIDANQNPDGAFFNERRLALTTAYDRSLGLGAWSTTLSFTHNGQNILRGFLNGVDLPLSEATGYREEIDQNDVYFDSHLEFSRSSRWRGVAGLDLLHGNASAEGDVFDYEVRPDGANPPVAPPPSGDDQRIQDRRDFAGLYGYVAFTPTARWRLEGGLRLNATFEKREEGDAAEQAGDSTPEDERNVFRPSGTVGATFTAWERDAENLRLYAAYRNTYKPAAIDFGLSEGEAEGGILEPETAQSYELGARTSLLGGRLSLELAGFYMDFENLVISQSVNGLPSLANAGKQRFKGVDASLRYQPLDGLTARATYGLHDTRFRDYLTEFDGEPAQLAGKRLEMSPRHQGALALTYARERGVIASFEAKLVGGRFLNKRNTASADGYATLDAMLGYRVGRLELRVCGTNLSDARDPVSESELGDAQYYLLPARRFDARLGVSF
jgi:outer membrane receptor protein involved in Fe transport